jgi:chorismate mutase/prephenate dehydrogenase
MSTPTSQNPDDPFLSRPLPILRAMIDSIDHEILQLLSRRNGVVAEIAAFKREHRVPIRDHTRERELLADRRHRAGTLGLSPEVIESVYRLVLWASRDRQAALKAEVPHDIEARTIAVIGGTGAMGAFMAQFFRELGHIVLVADLDTQLTAEEAAAVADVVVISVPIARTCAVIDQLGPLVRPHALIMDVTSIKTEPLRAMLESTTASVIGTHPLFGPSVHSAQGQRIVLTPGRGDEWLDWLKRMLGARGLNMLETTADLHDRAMAIVQVLTHFATEVMGRTLCDLGTSIEETLAFTSPVYLMELLMTGRHFAQSPSLYAQIQMSNPQSDAVTGAFVEAATALRDVVIAHDEAAFERMFQDVRALFGGFTDQALEESSFLIDRLVERM